MNMITQEADALSQLEYLKVSEERLDNIESTIKDLSDKVAHLDNSFVEVNITLRDYASWTKELSNTIKELAATVREMNNKNQTIPYDRLRDIQAHIDPIHEILRRHESEFISRRDAYVLASLAVFFIGGIIILLGAFGKYVLDDVAGDILASGTVNKDLIEKNSRAIYDHDKTKNEVLRSLHSHIKDK